MSILRSVWEQTQYRLVDDFLDLLLPPTYEGVETDYPRSRAMEPWIEKLFGGIEFPETKLLRLEQYWDAPTTETFSRRLPDWTTVLCLRPVGGIRARISLKPARY